MLQNRPHTLRYKLPASAPTQDNDGNWIPGAAGEDVSIPCRYEPNGSAKVIAGQDGTSVLYNGVVYLDKSVTAIGYGTPVNVYDGDDLVSSGSVIRFSAGQMNARLWV